MQRTVLSFFVVTTITTGTIAAQAPRKPDQQVVNVQPAASSDPTGTFDFVAVAGPGRERAGRMVIRGTPGHYEGTFGPEGAEPLAFSTISMARDTVVLKLAIPEGTEMTFRLTFGGSSFNGTFEGYGTGTISGNKVR